MLIEKKSKDGPFYSILSNITKNIRDWALGRKSKRQQAVESNISRIDYYLNLKEDLLNPTTRGALQLVSTNAKEVIQSIKDVEKWNDRLLSRFTKNDNLHVLCFDCFLFGLFALFVGPFQDSDVMCIDCMMQTIMLAIVALSFHCVLFEYIKLGSSKSIFRPSVLLHGVVLIACIFIGYGLKELPISEIDGKDLYIIAVVFSFIGFILYLVLNVLVNVIILVITLIRIEFLKINSSVKSQQKDIARYSEELNKIDETIREKDLENSITVNAGTTNTKSC